MSELRECPSKIEEYNPVDGQFFLITKNGTLLGKAWDIESARIIADAFDQAVDAQNRRHRPKPEPLTLEHLREMDGEPVKHWVWIENFKSPENSGYMRTHSDWSEGEYFCCGWPGVSCSFEYADYGKTWLVYPTRPDTEWIEG